MPRSANNRLVDALVRHQVFLTGYAKDLAARVGNKLDETTPEMRAYLQTKLANNDTEIQSLRRLRKFESELTGLRTAGWDAAKEQFIDSLVELLQYEPEFLAESVSRVSGSLRNLSSRPEIDLLRGIFNKPVIAGRTLAEVWKTLVSGDLARIIGATRIGYLAREAGGKIAARVVGTAKALSPVVTAALTAIDTIVATAVTALSSAARDLAVAANRTEFTLWELWVSVLDNNTTVTCWNLNGKLFKYNEGIRPGYHYGCRSDRVPLMEGEEPPSKVEAFADWLDIQGAKFKQFVGKMKKFTRVSIKPLTLDEVKRLDKETFE